MNIPREPRVPIADWGKDHWSTLAYVETCIVDNGGRLDKRRMRCLDALHPQFAHGHDASGYPTRLRGGMTAEGHDDWSCVEDMVAEGLLEWRGTGAHPVFALTPSGQRVTAKLRAHKATGGNFAGFATKVAA